MLFSYCACILHRQACEAALKEKHNLDAPETEGFVDETAISISDQLKALNLVFEKAAEDDSPTEVSIDALVWTYMTTIFLIFCDTFVEFRCRATCAATSL